MNTLQLKNALDGVNGFIGVFSLDQFFFLKDIEGMSIVNTQSSNQPGEHWFVVDAQNNNVIIFDSYGLLSPVAKSVGIMDKIFSKYENLWMNTYTFQSLDSNVCGDYCLFYIIARAQGYSVLSILTHMKFFKSSHERDHAIRRTVMKWCRILPPLSGDGDDNVHVSL